MKNTISTYLKNLKFDKNLAQSFKARYITNIRIVILLIILIVAAGLVSFFTLPKRLNPEIKIPIVSVVTVLPGAPPKDVERLVTKPLEASIHSLKGISELDSSSSESVSVITIQFNSNINSDKAKDDTQAAVDSVNDLPADAQIPSVKTFDFEDTAVWTFSLRGQDAFSQSEVAKRIKKKLEDTPSLDRVTVSGLPTQQIQIIAKPEAMNTYGINPLQLSRAITSALSSYPGGNVTTGNSNFPIGIDAGINSIDDIRNTILTLNSEQVKIGDITDVMQRSSPNQKQAFYADKTTAAENVITFAVYKTSATTIDKGVNDAKAAVDSVLEQNKDKFTLITVSDFSKDIDTEFGDLINNFRDTLILVFITFLVFLGVRQAIIAVLTIPLTFLVTFTVINAMGLSLNFLTLFSLLLSLGLLVDDTIVVVTGMTSYYRTKKFTPKETGLLVWRDFIVPIWTTTITTVWAFVPLLLATGIIGEFIKSIPIVVSVTLYASTAIAVLITLPLMVSILKLEVPKRVIRLTQLLVIGGLFYILWIATGKSTLAPFILLVFAVYLFVAYRTRKAIKGSVKSYLPFKMPNKNRLDERLLDIEHFSQSYKRIVLRILNSATARKKVLFAVIIFVVFAFALVPLGFVVNEFFPKSGTDYLYVSLEMPSGTSANITTTQSLALLDELRMTDGISYTTLAVGQAASTDGFGGGGGGDNTAQITLNLPEKNERHVDSLTIAEKLREKFKTYTKAKVTVVEQSGGPPAGSDVSIRLLGDDFSAMDTITDKLTTYLSAQPGVINVQKSIKPGTSKLAFVPSKEKLAEAGISVDTAGLYLRLFATGTTVNTVTWNDEKTDIVFRTSQSLQTPEDTGKLTIPTQTNEQIPLLSLGELHLETNPTTITHHDATRVIEVSAGVSAGYSASTINADLQKYANSLTLPDGYTWQTGGANEENQKSVASILQAMLLSALLIIATMVIQFRSYRKAALVMSVIPIAISGVFVVFALTGTPLSFPGLIGILSLFGIVVTHAMMLIDKINRNITSGMPFKEALADGAASRLEPVFIGSFTTIVGLIPISLSNPLWRGLGGAIIAGLSFSGIIMLFFIPVLYYIVYHNEYEKKRVSK